nr:iron-containing alcohol dehydrogenase family protein [Actinomycetota bacterium]
MTAQSWTHTGYTQQIVFGAGAVRELGRLLRAIGARRVLLVTTEGRMASEEGAAMRRSLGADLASTFARVESHVPIPLVQEAVRQARRDAVDAIVSFGGGSCADLAKAVCFFTEQESGIPSTSWADRPALPHVSVPTTYSGAELTPFFGMTDPATHTKSGGGGPTLAPIAAVYDPELTLSTPVRVSAETGMNALAHCVEVVWSPERTPEAEAIAIAGLQRITRALPLVVADPSDVAVRAAMLEGAVLGGRCLQNASMGVHHGLAQMVGARAGIAHGLANAVLLPHTVRFNAEAVPEAVRRIAEAVGGPGDGEPGADAGDAIAALLDRLDLPSELGACGVTLDDVDAVARMAPTNRNVVNNP